MDIYFHKTPYSIGVYNALDCTGDQPRTIPIPDFTVPLDVNRVPRKTLYLVFQMPALTGLHNVPALTGLHNQLAGPALLGHLRLQSIEFRGKPLNWKNFLL